MRLKRFGMFLGLAILLIASLATLIALLVDGNGEGRKASAQPPVQSFHYLSVPGISQAEIQAIDQLRSEGASFTVHALHGTETYQGEDGRLRGYTVLLCEWLSELFDIPFTAAVADLSAISALLDAKDASFGIQIITPARSARSAMSEPIALRSVIMLRLENALPLPVIAQTRPLRYAFLHGAVMIDHLAQILEPDSYEAILVPDLEMARQKLQQGEVDAFIANNTQEIAFDSLDNVVVSEFFPSTFLPLSIATGHPRLEHIIHVISKALRSGAYDHLAGLYRQGYQEYRGHKFNSRLNGSERDFIQNNPVIPFATQYQSYPLSYYNTFEGTWEGAVIDVIREVERLSGLRFVPVNGPRAELAELMALLENGTAWTIPNLVQTEARKNRFLWLETLYIRDRFALLSKHSHPNLDLNDIPLSRIGLHRNSAFADMFQHWFPRAAHTVMYPNSREAFMALDRGEVDLVMSSQNRLAVLTHFYELSNYKANYLFHAAYEGTFGVNREKPLLRAILDKALPLIDTERILEQWQTKTFDHQARTARQQRPWLMGLCAMALIISALGFGLFAKSRETGKHLEKLVRKRTIELESEAARREAAEKEARAASEAKSRFLANMSHEIRTPMNGIVGFAELAMEADMPPKLKEYLRNIKDSAEWLLHIINDILDLTKIESGKMELENIPFSLDEIIRRCRTLVQPLIRDKRLALRMRADPMPGQKLVGDPTRLHQALMNLLSNAVKFTHAGSVHFTASVRQTLPNRAAVGFEIRDTGIGMSSTEMDKIFEPFTQADSTTTRHYGGTGLGLSIVRNIVHLMGGELRAQSSLGAGSVFAFELDFPTMEAAEAPAGRDSDSPGEKPRFRGLVLVCDDNAMNVEIIREHLRRVGLDSATAENGLKAYEIARDRMERGEKPFDLIFMDIFMPIMDGMEAASKISGLGTGAPIVALTANMMAGELARCRERGMVDSLGKPFTTRELWDCLARHLPAAADNAPEAI